MDELVSCKRTDRPPCYSTSQGKGAVFVSRRISVYVVGMMVALLVSACNAATDHIQITREIFLENGIPAQPSALVQTLDGGYVVVGHIGSVKSAWATGVDRDGKVQWRHLGPSGSLQ